MRRKYQTLDVVRMYATLTADHWASCLKKAYLSGSIEKLMSWRYGMQAGLADANRNGLSDEKLNNWVIKRLMNIEKCARLIIKRKNPIPKINPKAGDLESLHKAKVAKKKRDREFSDFLMRSNF